MSATNEDKQLTDGMNNMNLTCTKEEVDICACCGKEGSELNICNKCKAAKYCNATCKKKHRTKHKKKCERRAVEIQAELHEIQLFKQPPLKEDCPICFLPLPSLHTGAKYYSCCGKEICSGCIHAVALRDTDEQKCPFCRTPAADSEKETMKMVRNRVDAGDAVAMFSLGCYYSEGIRGLSHNHSEALELWHQAGELGYAEAYFNIGRAYHFGEGVERDNNRKYHYFELAAMGGVAGARHNLGVLECRAGNWDRAIKHFTIAAGAGYNDSVKHIQQLYVAGHATKEDYGRALRAYQKCLEEIRSEQRDNAAAYRDNYKIRTVECKWSGGIV